jgi:hypothetical protein
LETHEQGNASCIHPFGGRKRHLVEVVIGAIAEALTAAYKNNTINHKM